MACVAADSLVEALDEEGETCLLAADAVRVGQLLPRPHDGCAQRVSAVHVWSTESWGARWPLHRYFALRAEAHQRVLTPDGERAMAALVARDGVQPCEGLVSLRVDGGGGWARVDGVVCRLASDGDDGAGVEAAGWHSVRVRLRNLSWMVHRRG